MPKACSRCSARCRPTNWPVTRCSESSTNVSFAVASKCFPTTTAWCGCRSATLTRSSSRLVNAALFEVRELMYDLAENTRISEMVGNAMPFFNAWQEVIGRWAGLSCKTRRLSATQSVSTASRGMPKRSVSARSRPKTPRATSPAPIWRSDRLVLRSMRTATKPRSLKRCRQRCGTC